MTTNRFIRVWNTCMLEKIFCFAFLMFFLNFGYSQYPVFDCNTFTDPITITTIPNKPATTTFSNMMGVNVKAWENFPSGSSLSDVGSFIRSFHMMDGTSRDFESSTPAAFDPVACVNPIVLPYSTANCFACGGSNNMYDLRLKYCEWRKNNVSPKIITAIETLPFPPRDFPNKNYTYAEWGGTNQAVFDNARQYGKEFAKNYCPINTGHACVLDEVEITNEAWGNPTTPGIKALYRGFILGVNDYYTTTNPSVTYVESSFSFPSTMNKTVWRLKLSSGAFQAFQVTPEWPNDYIGTMIPTDCWPYLEGASVHPYSFGFNQGPSSCSTDPTKLNGIDLQLNKHPEARNGQFLTLLNFVNWKNANQPAKPVKVTEYGFDSQNVGQEVQGVYLVRSLLMMGRLNVNEAAVYELYDVTAAGTGLYETSGLLTTANAQKPAYHALKRFKSKLNGKVFLKKLNNSEYDSDNLFAYIVGNTDGTPTHLAVWRPMNITGNNDLSTTITALPIPNFPAQFSIASNAQVVKLGTEVADVTFNYSTIVNGANINIGAVPYLIPITAGTCKYDANGNLINCCAVNPGVIAGNQTSCAGYNPTNITSTSGASGGTGAITYSWERSTTSNSTGFTVISGASLVTYDPPSITQTTWYRRGALQSPCTAPVYSNVIEKTVSNISNPGTIGNNENNCTSYDPAEIVNLTSPSGGSGAVNYQWQRSTTSATSGFTNIAGATGATYNPTTITVSTWYRRGARTGTCSFLYSPAVAKTVSTPCCAVNETFVRSGVVSNCRKYTLTVTPVSNATNVVYTLANLPGNGYNPGGSSWTGGTTFAFTAPTFVTTGQWTLPSVTVGTTYTLILDYCFGPDVCPTYSITTNGCNKLNIPANCSASIISGIGTEISRNPALEIFPNPASDLISFLVKGMYETEGEIIIVNSNGVEVLTKKFSSISGKNEIDVSKLPNGSYTLIIKCTGCPKLFGRFVILRS